MSSQPLNGAGRLASSWTCPECGFDNGEGGRFCGQCGTDSERAAFPRDRCQHCGSRNDAEVEVCAQCGARLLIECPQCGLTTRSTVNLCTHCDFDYSRFVAQKVIEELDRREEEKKSVYARGLSAGIMVALIIFSSVIIIYILRQI